MNPTSVLESRACLPLAGWAGGRIASLLKAVGYRASSGGAAFGMAPGRGFPGRI